MHDLYFGNLHLTSQDSQRCEFISTAGYTLDRYPQLQLAHCVNSMLHALYIEPFACVTFSGFLDFRLRV